MKKYWKYPPSAFEIEVFYTFKLRPLLLFNSSQSNINLHNFIRANFRAYPCSCRDQETSSPLFTNFLDLFIDKGLSIEWGRNARRVFTVKLTKLWSTWNMPVMFIVLWAISTKIRICEQGTKPQTTIVACSWLGFLMPAVLFP